MEVAETSPASGLHRRLATAAVAAFRNHPADSLGALTAAGLIGAILVNALWLQGGPHPAPLLSPATSAVARETTGSLIVLPPVRPAERARPDNQAQPKPNRAQLIGAIQTELARRGYYDGAIDGIYGPKMDAAIRDFEQASGMRASGEPTEALLKALTQSTARAERSKPQAASSPRRSEPTPTAPSRRLIAIQRALTDFGYGQLRLTGVFDEPTRAAIEKFERERKLPVKGQISPRLLRELAAVTGRPLE